MCPKCGCNMCTSEDNVYFECISCHKVFKIKNEEVPFVNVSNWNTVCSTRWPTPKPVEPKIELAKPPLNERIRWMLDRIVS